MTTLTLTEMELETLNILLGSVGGCPHSSLRKFVYTISNKIPETEYAKFETAEKETIRKGDIMFKDNSIEIFDKIVIKHTPIQEMTLEQVCKELGKDIKIVK